MANEWQSARLIPVAGSGSGRENEQRATSALLAVLSIVRPFSVSLLSPLGATRSGRATVETFTEPTFTTSSGTTGRPDGLVRITSGTKAPFVALVEVKTGTNKLDPGQINLYIEIARAEGFDCVLTISNEIAPQQGVHPTAGVTVRKNSRVQLHHLSWTSVLTQAVMEKTNQRVSDPEQAWILGELIRYLEHPASGAMGFEDMGPNWVAVRDGARNGTLKKRDEAVEETAERWDQLLRFVALTLGSEIGEDVQEVMPKQHRADPRARTTGFIDQLCAEGSLSGVLRIPHTVDDMRITADLKARQISISTKIDTPPNRQGRGSISWLVNQLRDSPSQVILTGYAKNSRSGISSTLAEVREDHGVLLDDGQRDIAKFELITRTELGQNRRRGKPSSFVDSLVTATTNFYGGVLQELQAYQPRAPRLKEDTEPPQSVSERPTQLQGPPPEPSVLPQHHWERGLGS